MKDDQKQGRILIYTRNPENEYTESLSNSIHLAYSDGNDDFKPLNQDYGILFASATIDKENVIHEKGLKRPYLFRTNKGSFGLIAVRVDSKGMDDEESRGQILLWTSDDLIVFNDFGLVKLHNDLFVKEAICEYNATDKIYEIFWQDNEGNYYVNRLHDFISKDCISKAEPINFYPFKPPVVTLPGVVPSNILQVDYTTGLEIYEHFTPVFHTEIRLPDSVMVSSPNDLKAVRATAVYSDRSTVDKAIEWDYSGINFAEPGIYDIKGNVLQSLYPFPLASGYADPVILPWNQKYYYIATNDNVDDIGLYVRESDTIADLFSPGFRETVILNLDEEKDFIQTFWAPEFHVIANNLYILFAVSGKQWGPQCHIMRLKMNGDIMNPEDWETPIRVKNKDGEFLTQDGITLDMTYFKADGVSCLVWSYRKGIGTSFDTGSMLFIASVDEKNPSVLTSEPVLLSRPLYGWENIQQTINNEGPYPLITDDTVYITYSAGAANGYTYALGLLSIPRGSDFLDIHSWKKACSPVLSYYSINGVYGPGHNSFFRDYDGNVMIMYHGEEQIVSSGTRCTGMHRVHFKQKGLPVFNMDKDRDLNPEKSKVALKVIVK